MAIRRPITVLVALLSALVLGLAGAPAQAAVGDLVTVSGTVVDSDGAPLAGVPVFITSFQPSGFATAVTDTDGHYEALFTLTGDTQILSVHPGSPTAQCDAIPPVSATSAVVSNCVVVTYEQVTVTGTATTDDGSVPVQAYVNASDSHGTTYGSSPVAPDGTYSLVAHFPRGAAEITITGPDGQTQIVTGFANGDVISGVNFVYHPEPVWEAYPVTIRGTVTDKKGRAVSGAHVAYGLGGINDTAFATTAADGTYVIDAETSWNDELGDGTDAFVTIEGVRVAFLENIGPDADITVDYRIGKTRVFEPYLTDIDYRGDGYLLVDVDRKINADGTAEWAVCTPDVCTGAVFGTKKTEYLGPSPTDAFGIIFLVFRDTSGPEAQWLRVDPDQYFASEATFGPKKLDGQAWFDFQGDGPSDLVAWADANGQTSVWTWSAYDGGEEVTTQTVVGKFVSADHLDLDAAGGEELVLVTREGKNYTVSLVPSHLEDPVTVATGRGEPTVTYEDPDGDQMFDIVVTFPDRHKHRH